MIYTLINKDTRETVGYTVISPFDTDNDVPDSEILEMRLENAIDYNYIPFANYEWKRSKRKQGIEI